MSPKRSSPRDSRPLVGIAVDGASTFGRAVMRGAMQYINAQRRWEIFTALRGTFEVPSIHWPTCDGAIIAGAVAELVEKIRKNSGFAVSCSGASPVSDPAVVCLDDVLIGAMAAEHLMECRLQSFAYYGVYGMHSSNRYTGFSQTLANKGYSCVRCPVGFPGFFQNQQEHWPSLVAWLRSLPKPVGILTVDDAAAHDLAGACRSGDLGVPEHIAILGVNNDDLLCESASTPLSSVDCDFTRVGYGAARMLDRLMHGEKLSDAERHVRLAPVRIVKRQSTDVLAVDDPDVADALRYIREHACDPCSVDDVLRHVPTGRRRLERQFSRKLGYTPGMEILRVQIETAKQLLVHPELKLPEISRRCGFADAATFSRAFTRVTKTSPGVYRRRILPLSE